MDQLKKLLGVFNEKTTPSVEKKNEMWKSISGSAEAEKKEFFGFSLFLRRGAPLFAAVAIVVVGSQFYNANFARNRVLLIEPENWSSGAPVGRESNGSSYVGVDDVLVSDTKQNVTPQFQSPGTRPDIVYDRSTVTPAPIDYDTKEKDRVKDVSAYFVYYVTNVGEASTKVYEAVVQHNGVVVSTEMEKTYAFYTVTIPVSKFEEFRKEISPLAVIVKEETIRITDKQNEKTALETKISDLDKQIAAIKLQLAKETNATKKKALQANLDSLLAQKEQSAVSLKKVIDATTMAKVSISLREDDQSFLGNLRISLKDTFRGIGRLTVVAIQGAITGIFLASPILFIWLLIAFLVKRMKARR